MAAPSTGDRFGARFQSMIKPAKKLRQRDLVAARGFRNA
jgi:hypothetical protein